VASPAYGSCVITALLTQVSAPRADLAAPAN
jgi:hypothetical protein